MQKLRKLLAAATLLVLPIIAACGEDVIPPPATGSIAGQVSIEGMGIDGVSVNLSSGASTTTAGGGTYRFDGVEAGAYTVTISGFPADASFDATSAAATIPETGGSVTLDFRGSYIRTASIIGTVTVENTGLGGVTVVLSGMADATTATDMNGQYAFTGLRSGTYSVEISGFDMDEVGFGSLMSSATVGVGESKIISFDGTYLRTAGIMGQVSVEGVGLAGVTVTMTGEGEDMTDVTDAGGLYAFSKLRAGAYSVAISGYDPDEVEFTSTSMNVSVALGETANIPFNGTLLRTSGISGRVSLDDGTGLDGVTVTLAGAAEATKMTSGGGQYAFAGLAEGTYVVSMTNPDEVAYNFEETSATIVLGDSDSKIQNFGGTHTRDATISGMLFLDEAPKDGMYTANEPAFANAGIPIALQGPGVNELDGTVTLPDGSYAFEGKVAGDYRVLVNMTEEVATALATAGFAFGGLATGEVVTVAAGGTASANFAFNITHQTIAVGAVMGMAGEEIPADRARVEDVELELYGTAQDAEDEMNPLSEMAEKTDEMGMASFTFARSADTSPAGDDTDNIVFVKVKTETLHEDLVVSDNDIIEIQYPGVERAHAAPAHVRLLNVGVYFDFWVKSTDAVSAERGGDMGFGGWHTEVFMGEVTDESMPLMKEDPEDDTKMVNATMPTDDGMKNMGHLGKATFSDKVDAAMLAEGPAMFTVKAAKTGQPDGGEMWEQSDALTYSHNGLKLPADNTAALNDRGPIGITFTTQALTVGVYRETDDEPGFSNYQSKVAGGDQRPSDVSEELMVELMWENTRGRLTRYEYKAFDTDGERTVEVSNPMSFAKGLASFKHLPVEEEFTVRFHAGSDRKAVVDVGSSRNGRDVDTYGDDLEDGTSVGAFGDEGGAGPEVRLCPMSSSSKDDMCSTFGYQWASGSISGAVTRRTAGVGGAAVNLEAITSNHSPDDNTKTSNSAATRGNYGFASVQDGEYWVRTPATATNKADSARIEIYHDEEMDDDPDDGIIGTGVTATKDFALTALRLDIKGYVANDGNEGNDAVGEVDGIVRGDEAVAGVEVALGTITKVSTNKKDTTFNWLQTVMTNADGLYEFEDVTEGAAYVVRVLESADDNYTAGRSLGAKDDRTATGVASGEYPSVTAEGDFALPRWDYMGNKIVSTTSSVEVSNATGTVKADLVNFALLYTDGSMSGRVREAASVPGNITIELARCDTYASGDRCKTYDRVDFPTQRTQTLTNGFWEFEDLTEGYYEVNVGDVGFKPANIDDNSKIDDDASDPPAKEEHTKLVKGERDLASGNNFYIYDGGKDDDDGLASLVVMGTQNVNDGEEALTGVTVPSAQGAGGSDAMGSIDAITWASESITVIPTIAAGAKYTVTIPGTTAAPMVVGRGTGASTDDGVEFKLPDYGTGHAMEGTDRETMVTVTVTAANGYHDHEYSFDVSLAAPAGDELAGLSVRQGTFSGTAVDLEPGFDATEDEYRVSIPATVMSLHLAATLQDIKQEGMTVVTRNNDGTTSEIDRAPSRTSDPVTLHRFDVPVGGTTIASSIVLTVISEDEVEREIEININRDDTPTTPATLTGLTLTGVTLAFVSATTTYTASVANAVDMTTVAATAATGATAVITPADADANTTGHQVNLAEGSNTITIDVTGAGMTPRTYTVTVTRARAGANTPASGQPTISGTAKVGETLTADASGVTDADGMTNATLAYQWSSNDGSADSDISGATSKTYDPVADDVGNTLKVTVSFTDDGGQDEMVTSAATAAVAAADDVPTGQQVILVLDQTRIREFGGVSTVSARVSPASPTAFTVEVSAAAVSPADENDFTLSTENKILTFAANATRSTGLVTITAMDDTDPSVDAPNKTVKVSGSVVEKDATAKSPAELTLTIVDDDDVPGLPRAFNVAAGDRNAVLTWEKPANIGSAAITGYDYRRLLAGQTFRDSDTWTTAGAADARTVTVPELDNGEAYQFQLRAKNGVRKGGEEERFDGGPAVPGNGTPWPVVTLMLTPDAITEKGAATNNSVVTATVDAANTASKPFTVTVSAEAESPAVAGAFTRAGSTLSFAANATEATGDVKITAVDNPVDAADNATVMVSGTMSTGSTAPAKVPLTITDEDMVPGVPGTFEAAAGDAQVTLTWTFPATEGTSKVTGFEYRYKEGALMDADTWLDVSGGANVARLVVTGLTNDEVHNFELRAVSAAGNSPVAKVAETPEKPSG